MIVDFEQDPDGPLGAGNFRDDKGRITYLYDPDTAGQFIKTMPGSTLRRHVESVGTARALDLQLPKWQRYENAVAGLAGAPKRHHAVDARAGRYDHALAADDRGPRTDWASDTAPPNPTAQAGEALAQVERAKAAIDSPPAGAEPPAGAAPPATSEGAPPVAEGEATTPAQREAAAAVAAVDKAKAATDPRLQRRELPQPAPRSTGNLPHERVQRGETLSIKEGRPLENAVTDVAEWEAEGRANDERLRGMYEQQGKDKARAAELVRDSARGEYGIQVGRAFEARRKREESERRAELLKGELKKNDEALDPSRFMRELPAGKKIALVVLAALTGGFAAIAGQDPTIVAQIIDDAVERDIDRQKREIDAKRITMSNDISRLLDLGLRMEEAEQVARDRLIVLADAFAKAEAERVRAPIEARQQFEAAMIPRREERLARRQEILRQSEAEITRNRQEEESYALPPPVVGAILSPQDRIAMNTLERQMTEQSNANVVGDIVNHNVTPAEAEKIKNEANDFGMRLGKIEQTRALVHRLAESLGLYAGPQGYTGNAESGPIIGRSLSEHATMIDDLFAELQKARTMDMLREPSAILQNRFASTASRPIRDALIPGRLNRMLEILNDVESSLRRSYDPDPIRYYEHRSRELDRARQEREQSGPYRRRKDTAPSGAPTSAPTFRAE